MRLRSAAIKIHANSCLPELVYGVPVQCRTRTRVYVNAALVLVIDGLPLRRQSPIQEVTTW